MKISGIFGLFCLFTTILSNKYKLYKIIAFRDKDRRLLEQWQNTNFHTYFLNGITFQTGMPIIAVCKFCCKKSVEFENFLYANNIRYLDSLLNIESTSNMTETNDDNEPNKKKHEDENFNISHFNSYNETIKWMNEIEKSNEHYVKKIVIGNTSGNQELVVLKFSKKENKYSVFITAGAQGNDWLSPAIVLKTFQTMTTNDELLKKLTESFDFYFLPFMNPDGYDYSVNHDRFWEKNFRFYQKDCKEIRAQYGINLDQNWIHEKPLGTETECKPINKGDEELSEEETLSLATFLNKIAPKLMMFINIKSFTRVITIPFGKDNSFSNNYSVLYEILLAVQQRLVETYNVSMLIGHSGSLFYENTGSCSDWVKRELNVPLVYTIYMQNADNIIPQPSDIEPLSKQLLTILEEMLLVGEHLYAPLYNKQERNQIITQCVILFSVFKISH